MNLLHDRNQLAALASVARDAGWHIRGVWHWRR